ncbi:GNAT family N-acetyltransferase [Paenibacillus agricola]|uniref:GNAT family N-acetyltransferase n=1 Tax=Paenibacillus agricola TaxID=2716264 RepID=A0ABX0J7A9_9BACL|nr:GNAT family protein [Paenibacillus agricola]NHN31853.1 GNAT family N-acetyltransferase [Paenibacillus agricola]
MKIEDIFGDLATLETDRTVIRKLKIDDLPDMYAYCSDDVVSQYTTWDTHQTLDDTKRFIEFVWKAYNNHEVAPWGIEDKQTSKLIGTCGFVYWNIAHSRAELGYALSKDFWGQGLMSEVVGKIIDFGWKNMNLVRIEARCHLANIGSARVMEKSGMVFEGILRKHLYTKGEHQDVNMYAIIREGV